MTTTIQPEQAPRSATAAPQSIFDPAILRAAIWPSLVKLDPRVQIRNPVMFVVEIGAAITTGAWLIQAFGGGPSAAAMSLGGSPSPSASGCG
jgi:K+-transporting ATPase ATPase B chain